MRTISKKCKYFPLGRHKIPGYVSSEKVMGLDGYDTQEAARRAASVIEARYSDIKFERVVFVNNIGDAASACKK